MSLGIDKPWQPLTAGAVKRVQGQLGVYQLGDASGNVVYVGYAGGRSLFGLRSELEKHLGDPSAEGRKAQFRFEVNMQYLTRYKELLMWHRAQAGDLPELNRGEPVGRLGRLG